MKVVITEDIIRNALNESIDEFMINEGVGDAFKGVWGYAKKAGNWLKNAAAMYMDKQTNGQWNQKYGIYVNGNTKTGELYYLNKWLDYYKQQLNNIIYRANNPTQRDEYETWERDKNNPNKEYKKVNKYDYVGVNGALAYAQKYCTFQNFNDYVRSISPKRENVQLINTYIYNYITKQATNKNINAVLNNLNIGTFYSSNEGQEYIKMNRGQQQKDERRNRIQNAWDERKANRQKTPKKDANYTPNNGVVQLVPWTNQN